MRLQATRADWPRRLINARNEGAYRRSRLMRLLIATTQLATRYARRPAERPEPRRGDGAGARWRQRVTSVRRGRRAAGCRTHSRVAASRSAPYSRWVRILGLVRGFE